MDHLFWFSLLLIHLQVSESIGKENCLWQPASQAEEKAGQSAVLECTITAACSENGMLFEWFVFKENNHHHHLDLSSNSYKFSLDKASLHINSLDVNDSGIYHCAAVWPGEPTQGRQYVGPGTTLIVRENFKPTELYIHLWIFFAICTIYSLTIVSLIVFKKSGCTQSICRENYKKNSTKNENRRTQFRDVLEEMYSKKNLKRQKQTAGPNEAASADINSSNDDIYQNV
ncbi:immunoglobulin superfamily member 6 [Anabas testudineus]|uniref:immunoglobulin superfamily member 6 n=1 Tax=Anabas testudineus TaxID=64144 RepID=UPI000E457743|nr:immunoglobulin superfamily member 6 [Anabas testudineus]